MQELTLWSLVSVGIGVIGLALAILATASKGWKLVGVLLGAVGLVLGFCLHTQSLLEKSEQRTADAIKLHEQHVDERIAELADTVIPIVSYDQFLATICEEVQHSQRWLVTRFMSRQAPTEGEVVYFEHLNRRLTERKLLEHQRLVYVPDRDFAEKYGRMLESHKDNPAFEIRVWSPASPCPNFELLIGDKVVILMQGSTNAGGPPSQGFLFRGDKVADAFVGMYAALWNRPDQLHVKDRASLDPESLEDAKVTLRGAIPVSATRPRQVAKTEPAKRESSSDHSKSRHEGPQAYEGTPPAARSELRAPEELTTQCVEVQTPPL